MRRHQYCYSILLLLHIAMVYNASASVTISNTRVVYQGDVQEVSLRLHNQSQKPVLVQSWIDQGDGDNNDKNSTSVPFILTPPIFRLDAERSQTLRIFPVDITLLPKDQESVFWVNVLDIPLKPTRSNDSDIITVALRSRIKLFYRPKGLKDSPSEAARRLRWHTYGHGIIATNDSSLHVSLANIHTSKNTFPVEMVSPRSSRYFDSAIAAGTQFNFTWLDDYGAVQTLSATME